MMPYGWIIFQELFLIIIYRKRANNLLLNCWQESQLYVEGLALPRNHNGVWPPGVFLPNPLFHFTFARLQLRVPDNSA